MPRTPVLLILASISLLVLAVMFEVSVFASVESNAYVDSKNQFSINPPSGWTVDSSGAFGTAVILYGPTDLNFRINMNVVVQATTLSLSNYVSLSKSQLSTSLTNYRLVSEGPVTIKGIAAYELVNNFTQGVYNIEDKQDVLVQNQKAYIITSTALQTDYGTYQPSFDESVQTFQLTAPSFPWLIVIVGAVVSIVVVVGIVVFFMRRMSRASVPPPVEQPLPGTPPPPS